MNPLKAIGGGLVGALVGALIWIGIGYGTHREVGWIAWEIGGLVGLGVKIGGQGWQGIPPGVIAAVIAILTVVVSKFLVVALIVNQATGEFDLSVSDQNMQNQIADDIIDEQVAKGKKVKWAPGKSKEMADGPADYPKEIWAEAMKKWNAMSDAEKKAMKKKANDANAAMVNQFAGEIRNEGFKKSFSPFDILWFLLATFTAFKIASGLTGQEQ